MSRRSRFFIDFALLIGLLVANAPARTGIAIHEWLSIALVVPLLVHLVINWEWTVHVTKTILRASDERFAAQSRRRRGALRLHRGRDGERVGCVERAARAARVRLDRQPAVGRRACGISIGDDHRPSRALRPAREVVRADAHGAARRTRTALPGLRESVHDRCRTRSPYWAQRRYSWSRSFSPLAQRMRSWASTAHRRSPRRPWRPARTASPPTGPPRRARRPAYAPAPEPAAPLRPATPRRDSRRTRSDRRPSASSPPRVRTDKV